MDQSDLNYYRLDQNMGFGQFKDLTLKEVIMFKPSYIEWCLINVSFFTIDYVTLEEIVSLYPKFKLSEDAHKKMSSKASIISGMEHDANIEDMRSYDAYEGDGWAWIADNG